VASRETLAELEQVLARRKFLKPMTLRGTSVADVLVFVLETVDLVEPVGVSLREIPELQDPDDAMFLFLASSSGASILVSGDRHLLDLGIWRGVRILGPGEAVKVLRVR
jgi:putative PIN family toxin of toxin-antitoxin system